MNISGLNIAEISCKLVSYIEEYFQGSDIAFSENGMFSESYQLDLDEIKWLLQEEHYIALSSTNKSFNGASGNLEFDFKAKEIEGMEYTVMLLSDESYSKALLLCLEERELASGNVEIKVVKDFIIKEGA